MRDARLHIPDMEHGDSSVPTLPAIGGASSSSSEDRGGSSMPRMGGSARVAPAPPEPPPPLKQPSKIAGFSPEKKKLTLEQVAKYAELGRKMSSKAVKEARERAEEKQRRKGRPAGSWPIFSYFWPKVEEEFDDPLDDPKFIESVVKLMAVRYPHPVALGPPRATPAP